MKRAKRYCVTSELVSTKEGTIDYVLKRSSRRRTLAIVVDEQAQVSVSVPFSTPVKDIENFIHEKARWILKGMKTAQENHAYVHQKQYQEGDRFLFMGKSFDLRVKKSAHCKRASIRFLVDHWEVTLPALIAAHEEKKLVKAKLQQWYRQQAKEIVGGRIFAYSRLMKIEPREISIRTQKRMWGCCDYTRQSIIINWQIILSPAEVIDYVVLHEMCHLLVPNHSRRFWSKVKKYMPDYESRKAWLKKNFLEMILP